MCTMIVGKTPMTGSAKGPEGWFAIDHAYIGYDHPTHTSGEHALTVDFVNEAVGPGARTAVELPRASARQLAHQILATLDQSAEYE